MPQAREQQEPAPAPAPSREELVGQAVAAISAGEEALSRSVDPEAALEDFEKAVSLARQAAEMGLEARSLTGLASAHMALEHYQRARGYSLQAIAAARRAGDRRSEAWALLGLGEADYYLGNYEAAVASYRLALRLMRETDDRPGEGRALMGLGIGLRAIDEFGPALDAFHQAREVLGDGAPRDVDSVLNNLGMTYFMLGARRLALDAYEEALERARQRGDDYSLHHVHLRLGDLYLDLDRFALGLDHFRQALAIIEALDLPAVQAGWAWQGISYAREQLGDDDGAIEALEEALAFYRRAGFEVGVQNVLVAIGDLYLDRDPEIAMRYLRRGLAELEERDRALDWMPHYRFARGFRALGDLDNAIDRYQRAIDAIEATRRRLGPAGLRASYFSTHLVAHDGLVETLLERRAGAGEGSDIRRAFAVAEQGRARVTLEGMSESELALRQDLSPELERREADLLDRLASLQDELLGSRASDEQREDLLIGLRDAERELDDLVAAIKLAHPRYAELRYPQPLDVGAIQALLDGRTALLAYSLTPDEAVGFLVTASSFRASRLAEPARDIAFRVGNYVDFLARGDGSAWPAIGRRIFSIVLAPFVEELPSSITRLVLVPDGALHYLPFEALVLPDASADPAAAPARFLLERYTVSYAPSATVWGRLKGTRTAGGVGPADVLAIGVSTPALLDRTAEPTRSAELSLALFEEEGLRIGSIPFSAVEARAVEGYGGPGSEALIDSQAVESRLKSPDLVRFRVIHFATHALISARAPGRSALALASGGPGEDGLLQAREIASLRLASDLVVLSACQTALGRMLDGEGIVGLAQSFLHAGTRSLVTSLWSVSDRETVRLMESFYDGLAEGKSKADALRAAKLEMVHEGVSPRYWAPFILIGEADGTIPLSPPARRRTTSVALTLGVVAALCFILGWLRRGRAPGRRQRRAH